MKNAYLNDDRSIILAIGDAQAEALAELGSAFPGDDFSGCVACEITDALVQRVEEQGGACHFKIIATDVIGIPGESL